MKTIALFGGSGRTGKPFIRKATGEYKIKALVRDPQKLDISHENLQVIGGDVINPVDLEKCIAGSDIVVSLIGHGKDSAPGFQTAAIRHILQLMDKHDVKRIVTLTGGGVRDQENDRPGVLDKLVVFVMKNLAGKGPRNALEDGINHAQVIRNTNTDWTIIRAPLLTEDPAKGYVEAGFVGTVKGFKLTREDLAQFILQEINEERYVHQMPFVTNGK